MTDLGKSTEEIDQKLVSGKRYSLYLPKNSEACKKGFGRSVDAKLMMREISLFASSIQIRRKWVFLFVFLRAIIPYIIRWAQFGSPVYGFGVDSYLYSLLDIIFGTLFLLMNYIFILAGLIDFQRRSTIMKACSAMLNPMKSQLEPKFRIFPTVLMTCTQSMHSWFQMRLCLMDLGRKYVNRIFIYSSTFLGCYLFYAIILILQYFDLINLEISPIFQAIALYDIIFTLTNIFAMLFYGAVVNEQFTEDQMLLMKQKSVLIYIKSNIETIMHPCYEEKSFPLVELGLPKINQLYLKIYQNLLFGIKKKYNYTNEQLGNHILNVVHELDTIRERLDMDSSYAPLKLLGFKASYSLLNRIYTGIATLMLAMAQKMMNKPIDGGY
ncbi:hypothetical protein FGO68_gene6210 [Halteria grandinella]|uniref:Uncharacterized protein n=1 Tax=Halteria grandinella TaxID=5974 RepID=A0A8J8T6X5_HALGN|nr:hypothetical protein FGO68_gene6210 [Halteria grandinella]